MLLVLLSRFAKVLSLKASKTPRGSTKQQRRVILQKSCAVFYQRKQMWTDRPHALTPPLTWKWVGGGTQERRAVNQTQPAGTQEVQSVSKWKHLRGCRSAVGRPSEDRPIKSQSMWLHLVVTACYCIFSVKPLKTFYSIGIIYHSQHTPAHHLYSYLIFRHGQQPFLQHNLHNLSIPPVYNHKTMTDFLKLLTSEKPDRFYKHELCTVSIHQQ